MKSHPMEPATPLAAHIPQPVPEERRARRVLMCVLCHRDTGIEGAVYCDPCRKRRNSDELLSEVDRERDTMKVHARCALCSGEARSHPGKIATIKHRGGCEYVAEIERGRRREHRFDHDDDRCVCGGQWVYFEPVEAYGGRKARRGVYGCSEQTHAQALKLNDCRDQNDSVSVSSLLAAIERGDR